MFACKYVGNPLGWLARLGVGRGRTVLGGLALGFWVMAGLVSGMPGQAQSANRWLEVGRISGTVTTQVGGSRAARVGDRLSAPGHGVTTQSQASASLEIDSGIGTLAVAQNTQLTVQQLSTLPDGARITILNVPRGQVRVQARSFTNPNSRLELHTPTGVAAVRGTDFGVMVAADGKTSVAALEGSVAASAQSVTVSVDAGLASVMRPGEPPTRPSPLDRTLDILWERRQRRGNRLFLSGRINPTNTLFLDGEEVAIMPTGRFERTIMSGGRLRSVELTVENPLGESRVHRLQLWQTPDLDRVGR